MGRFELNSFLDLYEVAKANKEALENGTLDSVKAFNALCSINHLKEWLEKDDNVPDEVKKAASYVYDSYDTEGGSLNIIRGLCNAQKHYDVTKYTPKTSVNIGYGVGRYGTSLYGVGEPSYKVAVSDSTELSFLKVINDAMSLWDKFVQGNFNG